MPPGSVSRGRRRTVLVASIAYLLMLAVIAVVWPVSLNSEGRQIVIVGPWTGDVIITVCVVASVVLLAVIVFAVPARRWWWLLLAPLRIVAVAAVALGGLSLLVLDESVTPIVADGCDTGYVVSERSFLFAASGTVLRRDGVIGTEVGRTSVDDGHKPFSQQSYLAVTEGDTLRVWNTFQSRTEHLSTASEPSFVLPRLTTQTGCGLAGGIDPLAQPAPTSSPIVDAEEGPAPAPVGDSRERVARMAAVTLEAARGTAVDATGSPVRAPSASDLPCDGATGVDLAFATDDNAASYEAILAAWDAAGFFRDRAMQEDLRDDGVVRLSARDRTTIDGLLHFSLTAECRAG